MHIDSMQMTNEELEQLEIELEAYLDSVVVSDEVNTFSKEYSANNRDQVIAFYSGFKAALYTMQRYPELLKEKKDEAQE